MPIIINGEPQVPSTHSEYTMPASLDEARLRATAARALHLARGLNPGFVDHLNPRVFRGQDRGLVVKEPGGDEREFTSVTWSSKPGEGGTPNTLSLIRHGSSAGSSMSRPVAADSVRGEDVPELLEVLRGVVVPKLLELAEAA